MATINRLARQFTAEGAPAKRIDLVAQLERSVMSCLLWEDEFYEDGATIASRIVDLCAKVDAKEVGRIAIQAKEDMRLRHVPLLLAREMCRTEKGRAELKHVLPRVITRPDDINEFIAFYWQTKKEPLAKQVKKLLGEAFRKFDEYQLQKYNGGKKAIKLRDVMKLCRPKPADEAQASLWKRLVKGELATPDTWEVELSASKDKKESWTRLLKEEKLGGLAMLRNLRNMRDAGVDQDLIRQGIAGINAGRLLPMNFISAARHNPQFEHYLEAKFLECFGGREKLPGRTVVMVDISGSMDGRLAGRSELTGTDVACALAMIARETCEDVQIVSFSNNVAIVPARRGFALREAIINSQSHGGTMIGASVMTVARDLSFDRLIVITDEQSHDRVPDMKGYMINVASNKNGVGYGAWLHIDGWSDKVLNYIMNYERNQ